MHRSLMLVVAVLVVLPLNVAAQLPEGLTVEVFTDKTAYNPGETVNLWFELCNRTTEELRIYAPMACLDSAYQVEVLDESDQPVADWYDGGDCMAISVFYPQAPSACSDQPGSNGVDWGQTVGHFPYHASDQLVPPGEYRVCVTWYRDGPQICSQPFVIRATALQNRVPVLSLPGLLCLVLGLLAAGTFILRRTL